MSGAFTAPGGDVWIPHASPSDVSDVVALVPEGSATDVALVAAAAAEALPAWRRLAGPTRADHLYAWSTAIAARHEELAQAVCREVGKPIAEARGEVGRCLTILRYYAGEAVRSVGDVIPAQIAGALQYTLNEPLGVVALVTPWNFPLAIPLWKAAPALAFGNTVVLKPSEMASHTATLLAETARDASLPAGVFNMVLGRGATAGAALLRAPGIRAISFTGSARVGREVAVVAAERNIRFQTEMGGKNVVVVLADADIERAAALTAAGAMRFGGQKCTATSRAIVVPEVATDFAAALERQIERLPLGPVTDPAAAVGPLITAAARDELRRVLDEAGAEPVYTGTIPNGDGFARGNFFAPLVVRGGDPDGVLAQRELFGPVLATFTASDIEEAIALANRTPYGLSASLFTGDLREALRWVRDIEVGLVRVNGDTTGVDPHAPFGGMKGSSSGSREQGPAAREFYCETKTVQINP
ncbi:MAG TPA: aldehyde dehydrogenase family protein [Gemmatimonadaceae bacterium]|nr:aldehyde dehydrogenase family protein [Gemmatimonadaceae bacterium]